MIIYPAIDLKDGACVRLHKGEMAAATVYNKDPAAQAALWQEAGFSWLHVVDLNGAIGGHLVNAQAVRAILKVTSVPIQLGGGLRSLEQIEFWLSEGIKRVILGTVAVKNPQLVKESCRLFEGRIAVGIDARKGRVAVEGWVEDSDISAPQLAALFEDCGVSALIYTDIDRDGTGQGLNMSSTIALAQSTSIPVIASGGVATLQDLYAVKSAEKDNVSGVIVGTALYNGSLSPQTLLKIAL